MTNRGEVIFSTVRVHMRTHIHTFTDTDRHKQTHIGRRCGRSRQPLVIARLHQELGSFIVGNMRVTLPKNMKEYEPDEAVLLLLELKDAGTPITLVMKAMHRRAYHAGGLACIGAVKMQV